MRKTCETNGIEAVEMSRNQKEDRAKKGVRNVIHPSKWEIVSITGCQERHLLTNFAHL